MNEPSASSAATLLLPRSPEQVQVEAARANAGVRAPEPGAPEFLNRDLSWLEFNRRVLHEALDDRTPLLERVRFLGIFTSNLDEFFMKRASSLKRQISSGSVTQTPEGLTPAQVLAAIRSTVEP